MAELRRSGGGSELLGSAHDGVRAVAGPGDPVSFAEALLGG
jgi:hypothetical protein